MEEQRTVSFDIELESQDLLNHPEMVQNLAKPGNKEAWIAFLMTGDVSDELDENGETVRDMLIAFLNSYALLTGYDQFADDAVVNKYFELMAQMQECEGQCSEELNRQMIDIVSELPAAFKDAVGKASEFGQEFLIRKLQAA